MDGAVTLAAGAGAGLLYRQTGAWARPSCPCDRADVWAVDRWAITGDTPGSETPANVAVLAGLIGPLLLSGWVASDTKSWANDALLITEAVAVSGLITQGLKLGFSRPYPYMYGPARWPEQNADGVNYASFPSGHTALPMAAAVAFAEIMARRHGAEPWVWVARIVGPALALTAGALQVRARNHFLTDVVAGGALGYGIGWGVVALH
ncbi:MAG: phosphatase PAP2 family protein [Myxococcales bacterium]|nr:phosphatase PAP2 family protein [Myxococcales bacterium]MCB9523021.1 phosphatase PAP2 family protein [Myxococcales bacterium]